MQDSRLVVLASGSGTLLQSLLDAGLPVVAVGADRPAPALDRAEAAGVPTLITRPGDHADRAAWDAELTERVAGYRPGLVVCAGFMRILGPAFLARFAPRIINSHPSLLPAFPGATAVRDALDYGVKVTGATVHVVDSGLDSGPVIAQECVQVRPGDDEETLHERIKVVERRLLVECVRRLSGGFTLAGRSLRVP